MNQGRLSDAEGALRKGLALHPSTDPDLGWLLAKVLAQQSRLEEARDLLLEQTRTFPESRLPYLGLAELVLKEHDWQQAVAHVDEALERTNAIDYAGKYEAAFILAPIPATRARAEALLVEVTEGRPDHALSQQLLGALLEHRHDPEAKRHLESARSLWKSPDDFSEFLQGTLKSLANFDQELRG